MPGGRTAASCGDERATTHGRARARVDPRLYGPRRRHSRSTARRRTAAIIRALLRRPRMARAPDETPPANSATMRAFVHWIRAAAPYVHAFRGKTFVIAFGGEVVADESFLGRHARPQPAAQPRHQARRRARLPAAGRGDPRSSRASRAATRTACASPTPTRWTACSRRRARSARASRRCSRSGSPIRPWPARATACRAATISPPSRWASSTASTCC